MSSVRYVDFDSSENQPCKRTAGAEFQEQAPMQAV